MDCARGHVHERAGAGADSRLVAEEVRDLALEDVEGLAVVLVAVQRNPFAALGSARRRARTPRRCDLRWRGSGWTSHRTIAARTHPAGTHTLRRSSGPPVGGRGDVGVPEGSTPERDDAVGKAVHGVEVSPCRRPCRRGRGSRRHGPRSIAAARVPARRLTTIALLSARLSYGARRRDRRCPAAVERRSACSSQPGTALGAARWSATGRPRTRSAVGQDRLTGGLVAVARLVSVTASSARSTGLAAAYLRASLRAALSIRFSRIRRSRSSFAIVVFFLPLDAMRVLPRCGAGCAERRCGPIGWLCTRGQVRVTTLERRLRPCDESRMARRGTERPDGARGRVRRHGARTGVGSGRRNEVATSEEERRWPPDHLIGA